MRCCGRPEPSVYPAGRPSTNPGFIPLGGHPQTQCLSRLAANREPRFYPAWRPSTNPVFIPLGGCLQTQRLSRLAAAHEPSIYPAWRPSTNPVFIPLGGHPQTQCLSRLAAIYKSRFYPAWRLPNPESCTEKSLPPLAGEGGRRPEGGNKKPEFIPLAAAREPSIYPAWRPSTNPVFIPLGGCLQTQRLSRLAAAHEPSIYPA